MNFDVWVKEGKLPFADEQSVAIAKVAWDAAVLECIKVISENIKEGPLSGNGTDLTAQRNGLILARNAIIARAVLFD